jgi:hypothetical protein
VEEWQRRASPGAPYRVERDRVSPEFFDTLGVPLLMGRSFTDEEMVYARSGVAILTYPFWRNYFNGDPKVLDRTFQMDGLAVTVVGVLPPGFRYLSRRTQLYVPAASDPAERAPDQRTTTDSSSSRVWHRTRPSPPPVGRSRHSMLCNSRMIPSRQI